MSGSRDGFGLPAVLVVLAVLAVAAIGVLRVGLERVQDARDATRLVRVQTAAESAVRMGLAGWPADSMRRLPAGGIRALPAGSGALPGGVTHEASAERIGRSRFLVRGEAVATTVGGAGARASAVAIVAMVPTEEIWRDFHSALVSRGPVVLAPGAVVDGLDAGVPTPWSLSACPAGLASTVVALLGAPDRPGIALPATGAPISSVGATITGNPPVWSGAPRTDSTDFLRLGTLPFPDVAAVADRSESATIHLAPAAPGGMCDTRAPGNWGAPGDPAHPCFDFFPLIHAPGGLEVASGSGQGILVAAGDVILRSGVSFAGFILATGRVELDGATVTGAVRAASGARVDGAIGYSTCVAGRTLERLAAFRRPVRLGARLWLPAF